SSGSDRGCCRSWSAPDALFGAAFFGFEFFEGIKKGPERPHAHRLNLGWPQPPPAVRLGTTTIRSLVIILRILRLGLPKGCAVIPPRARKSREGRRSRDFGSVTAFRRFGEGEFAVPAMREARRPDGAERNPGAGSR